MAENIDVSEDLIEPEARNSTNCRNSKQSRISLKMNNATATALLCSSSLSLNLSNSSCSTGDLPIGSYWGPPYSDSLARSPLVSSSYFFISYIDFQINVLIV